MAQLLSEQFSAAFGCGDISKGKNTLGQSFLNFNPGLGDCMLAEYSRSACVSEHAFAISVLQETFRALALTGMTCT